MLASKHLVNRPLYIQLRDSLIDRIARGDWKVGKPIPNEIELARQFGVSAGTVRKALDSLEEARLVVRQQGRGTFVRDAYADYQLKFATICCPKGIALTGRIAAVEVDVGTVADIGRKEMGWPLAAMIYRIKQIRSIDDRPFMLEQSVLPHSLFPNIVARADYDILSLAAEFGIVLGRCDQRATILPPPTEVAAALTLPTDHPAVLIERSIVTIDKRLVEWHTAWCRVDTGHSLVLQREFRPTND